MRCPKNDAQGYAFIVAYFTHHGKYPSYQDIANHMQYVSKRSVTLMLQRLSNIGCLQMTQGSIQLTPQDSIVQAIENGQSFIHNVAAYVGAMAHQHYINTSHSESS